MTSINKVKDLLSTVQHSESNYQFNNFFLENYPTPARRLVAVMRKIVELEPYTTTPFNTDQIIMFKNCVEYYESVKNKEEVLANFEKEEPKQENKIITM